ADRDVLAVGRRGPEAVDAACRQQRVADDLVEQLLRVAVQLARLGPLQDRRELALQVPGVEEELPVDVAPKRLQLWLDEARTQERRLREVVERDPLPVLERPLVRKQRLAAAL